MELTDRFGGATSFVRAPGQVLWRSDGAVERDNIAVIQVMAQELDRPFRGRCVNALARAFSEGVSYLRARRSAGYGQHRGNISTRQLARMAPLTIGRTHSRLKARATIVASTLARPRGEPRERRIATVEILQLRSSLLWMFAKLFVMLSKPIVSGRKVSRNPPWSIRTGGFNLGCGRSGLALLRHLARTPTLLDRDNRP